MLLLLYGEMLVKHYIICVNVGCSNIIIRERFTSSLSKWFACPCLSVKLKLIRHIYSILQAISRSPVGIPIILCGASISPTSLLPIICPLDYARYSAIPMTPTLDHDLIIHRPISSALSNISSHCPTPALI